METVSIGQAAHICGASPLGPRYDPSMTSVERSSINNGIWLCEIHAKIIDRDEGSYSVEKLKEWKIRAESKAAKEIQAVENELLSGEDTLICLDLDLMFTGVWKMAKNDTWTFSVKDFLFGNIERLKSYGRNDLLPMRRYVIVESQNEGRLLKEGFEWQINSDGTYEVTVNVFPAVGRRKLTELGGDLAHSYDGDILVEKGDFKVIQGEEFAKQLIERNLGLPVGGWVGNRLMGSYFSMYYNQYESNPSILNRLIKIEILRLMTIPTYQTEFDKDAELNFIKKIKEVSVMQSFNGLVPVFLSLEWNNGKAWSDTLYVRLFNPADVVQQWEPPEFVAKLFEEPPVKILEKLTSLFKGDEMKTKRDNGVVLRSFNETIPAILEAAKPTLEKNILALFHDCEIIKSIDHRSSGFFTSADIELATTRGNVYEIGVHLNLKGLKAASLDAFDVYGNLYIYFEDYYYAIGVSHQQPWHKKLYNASLSTQDIEAIAAQWIDYLAKMIADQIRILQKVKEE